MTTTISPNELQQLMNQDQSLQLLDVRTGAEFESVHIPGSVNVPLDALNRVSQEIAKAKATVVLVCQSGQRANQAHQQLAAAGKDGLVVLDGGIAAWQTLNGDVKTGTQRWAMERQVRLTAGLIVLVAVVASIVAPRAKWVAGFVGLGLTYSALSNTCTMATVLSKLPHNQTADSDIDAVVAELARA